MKFTVHPTIYKLSQLIYIIICITGLTIQIVQISGNYFKYDVVSEISVDVTPTKSSNVSNICFLWTDILNQSAINRYPKRPSNMDDWTFADILNVTYDSVDLLNCSKPSYIDSYIIKVDEMSWRCFQIQQFTECKINHNRINFRLFFLAMTELLPIRLFTKYNVLSYGNGGQNFSATDVDLLSHHIELNKLPPPYTDNCFNYGQYDLRYNFLDCYWRLSGGHTHHGTVIQRTDDKINSTIRPSNNRTVLEQCSKIMNRPDCKYKLIVTRTNKVVYDTDTIEATLAIIMGAALDPSMSLGSKERINNIDFLCFIMSAAGAWLGLSVLSINPLPYIMSPRGDVDVPAESTERPSTASARNSGHSRCENRLSKLSDKYEELKKRNEMYDEHIKYLYSKIIVSNGDG